jgi:hypothetical protein
MGNGMMCATTSKSMVSQGVANTGQTGAPPPPPPTGVVGGGGAPHLTAVVVSQSGLSQGGFDLVPMPLFSFVGGVAGGGYAFALWMLSAEIGRKSSTQNSSDNCSKCSDRSGNQSCFFGEIACVFMCVFCGSAIQFHLRHACTSSSIVGCIGIQKRCFRSQCRLGLSFKFSVQCAQTNNLRRVAVVKKHIFFIVRHSTRAPLTLDLANDIGPLRSYA